MQGVEPWTFALLARRSNQLSYTALYVDYVEIERVWERDRAGESHRRLFFQRTLNIETKIVF